MRYVDMRDVPTYTVYTQSPTATHITHCTFEGNRTQYGCIVLRLWGSPTVAQVVDTSLAFNVVNGNGLYLYNCKASFTGDTIRDCALVNSYLK